MGRSSGLDAVPERELVDLGAEQAVLGSCLLERDAIAAVSRMLRVEDFGVWAHQRLFAAMLALWERREPPDVVLVVSELRARGWLDEAGGEAYLAELIACVPTALHAEFYATRVLSMADRRRLVSAATAGVGRVWHEDADPATVASELADALRGSVRAQGQRSYVLVGEIAEDPLAAGRGRQVGGLFAPLDRITGGFERGQVTVLAARPSVGKSALALQLLYVVARDQGVPVGCISLEMARRDVLLRLLAMASGVNTHAVRAGWPVSAGELEALRAAREQLDMLPLAIDADPDTRLESVLGRARRLVTEQRAELLAIDYLQLMHVSRSRPENREREVAAISRALKGLARELDVPVIVLSQLNRNVEHRASAEPVLADLRDSGSLEQDADLVLLLHRTDEEQGLVQVHVAKNRNGPVGRVPLRFVEHTASFVAVPRRARSPRAGEDGQAEDPWA